jgi:hypothetical protein
MITLRMSLACSLLFTSLAACKKTESAPDKSPAPSAKPAVARSAWIGALPKGAKPISIRAADADSKAFEGLQIMADKEIEPADGGQLRIELADELDPRTLFVHHDKIDLADQARSEQTVKSFAGSEQPEPDLLILKYNDGHVTALRNIHVGGQDFYCEVNDATVEMAKTALAVCASLQTK